MTENHPLAPFFPSNAKLLMLGSFPPPRKRWKMDFYYPNLQNDMWRIFGICFFNDKDYFLTDDKTNFRQQAIEDFLQEKGIALSDTASQVIRLKENASDQFLEIVETIDLKTVLNQLPACCAIATTGGKAAETLQSIVAPNEKIPTIGNCIEVPFFNRHLQIWRMPSSSRAYPMKLEEKAKAYGRMFEAVFC